ncbi:hypothetical protein [Pullulanibacillus camelliae]|nr:hypothetical protein [Pullulanibacillus camelliae]
MSRALLGKRQQHFGRLLHPHMTLPKLAHPVRRWLYSEETQGLTEKMAGT